MGTLRDDARALQVAADRRVRELERDNAALRTEISRIERAQAKERHLRDQIHALQSTIEELRGRRAFKLPTVKQSRRGHYFTRVIIPDSHGCLIDKPAASAFISDLKALAPREIVMLGDHLDCSGFLSAHGVLGFEDERGYTYEQDIEACNVFLDEIQKAAPGAEIHYLEGNHEHRVRKWCVDKVPNQTDLPRMLRALHAEHVLGLPARGIRFYSWTQTHMGLRHPGTIKLGLCYFTHGLRRMPANGAKRLLERYGANVVFGHTHRRQAWAARTVRDESLGAWCPGCLCQLQATYQETDVSQWQHGYGVQFVRGASGEFQHLNVPIIDGRSFMVPLTGAR